jgi:hypothetical protein
MRSRRPFHLVIAVALGMWVGLFSVARAATDEPNPEQTPEQAVVEVDGTVASAAFRRKDGPLPSPSESKPPRRIEASIPRRYVPEPRTA